MLKMTIFAPAMTQDGKIVLDIGDYGCAFDIARELLKHNRGLEIAIMNPAPVKPARYQVWVYTHKFGFNGAGTKKIDLIKLRREIAQTGLTESKLWSETGGWTMLTNDYFGIEEATDLLNRVEATGYACELREAI